MRKNTNNYTIDKCYLINADDYIAELNKIAEKKETSLTRLLGFVGVASCYRRDAIMRYNKLVNGEENNKNGSIGLFPIWQTDLICDKYKIDISKFIIKEEVKEEPTESIDILDKKIMDMTGREFYQLIYDAFYKALDVDCKKN